jgi:large subunit ribosomal protein L20
MRVTNAVASRSRRKRMLEMAKGYRLKRSKLYRYASDAVDHGLQYAYRDRKAKKRNYRMLWQARINAAARAGGITYSRLIEGLKAAQITSGPQGPRRPRRHRHRRVYEARRARPERAEVQGGQLRPRPELISGRSFGDGRPSRAARFAFSASARHARAAVLLASVVRLLHILPPCPCSNASSPSNRPR